MRIKELLSVESILLDGICGSKKEVLDTMVELMAKSGKIAESGRGLRFRTASLTR